MIIQALLLLATVTLAVVAARSTPTPGHLALRRLLIVGTMVTAALSVLFPDAVTRAARLVGVGRGTDLVLYVFIVVAVLGWLSTHRRLTELDHRLAQVVRSQALTEAVDRTRVPSESTGDR